MHAFSESIYLLTYLPTYLLTYYAFSYVQIQYQSVRGQQEEKVASAKGSSLHSNFGLLHF
jgi:hypothetical protein